MTTRWPCIVVATFCCLLAVVTAGGGVSRLLPGE
jgi:hypothetical protein